MLKSTPPAAASFSYDASNNVWKFGFFVKSFTIVASILNLIFILTPIEHSFNLMSRCGGLGFFLIITWILWIPIILLAWYSFETDDSRFLLPFMIFNIIYLFNGCKLYFDSIFPNSYFAIPSTEEALSIPRFKEIFLHFIYQSILSLISTIGVFFCMVYFELIKIYQSVNGKKEV